MNTTGIVTINILLPEIQQSYNKALLACKAPMLREWSGNLWDLWLYIENELLPRARDNPERKERCEKLIQEFKELYGRTVAKEKELESETKHPTQRPFYSISSLEGKDEKIFGRLKWKSLRKRH